MHWLLTDDLHGEINDRPNWAGMENDVTTIKRWVLAESYSDGSESVQLFATKLEAVTEMVCSIQGTAEIDPELTEVWTNGEPTDQAWAQKALRSLQAGDVGAGEELIESWASGGSGELWWILQEIEIPLSSLFSLQVCRLIEEYQAPDKGSLDRAEIRDELAAAILTDLGVDLTGNVSS